ncbi:hypothetical protein M0R45_034812 [Rubus argutus]|uniref:Uncharacterized protein n=1 Tax=Rubus argutus TaxID=59490 RepID=A0AAW1VTQ8_RUBAR
MGSARLVGEQRRLGLGCGTGIRPKVKLRFGQSERVNPPGTPEVRRWYGKVGIGQRCYRILIGYEGTRARFKELKAWDRSYGLGGDGAAVVIGLEAQGGFGLNGDDDL